MKEDIIAGLDIGSTETRIVVAQKSSMEEGDKMQVIGATSIPTSGISKGAVKSIEDVTSTISAILEKIDRLVGVPIEEVCCNINSQYVKCERNKGVVAVSTSNKEITYEDVVRAIDSAKTLSFSAPLNYEILHVIPIGFTVDDQQGIKDPVGMTGNRLEVEVLIIQVQNNHVKNLKKAIHRANISIENLVLSPLAPAEATLSDKQKELGVVIVDIGSSTTGLAVFEEENLIHSATIPIGSSHITNDIAIGLRCPITLAEKIKTEYATATPDKFSQHEKIDISDILKEEDVNEDIFEVSKKYISEIVEARVEEIFEKVDDELKKIERSGMLPAGVVLVGGGSKMNGIIEVAKNQLKLSVSHGSIKNIDVIIDKVNDLSYLTAVGLAIWGSSDTELSQDGLTMKDFFDKFVKRIGGVLKRFKT